MKRKHKLILRLIIRRILYELHGFPEKFIVPRSVMKLKRENGFQPFLQNHILQEKGSIPLDRPHFVPGKYGLEFNAATASAVYHFLSQNKAGLIHFFPEIFSEGYNSFAEHGSTRFFRYSKENWKIFQPHEKPENKRMLLRALRVNPGWRLWLKKRYSRNHSG